ncbi:S41 family peptidase [Granulosicoccus antarcticus]|uniref:Carboxy-terminal processing protease CtpB n=1 Tax=Granulosicoccus antarcticus IMCC3135 TaxID=1192854 RepID=A0A2Z2NZK2_9GAMM|nr:S41 family peptidase [Granulosicoccus antarcticus]ASJ76693.1 Carboxy-terminal processing protease CtpB [Granulosicoccus antarcticus IMCC3135]
MKAKKSSISLVLLGAVIGGSLTLGQHVMGARSANELPLEQMRTFTDVFTRIKNDYVEEVSDEELLEYAIRGMLNGLDPHSAYLNTEEFNELRIGTTGEFGGLGIEVGMEDGFVKVVSPIDDTPAARAGILSGDLIIRLDETPVKGLSLNDAVKLMRGKPGSTLTLTIIREGADKPLSIDVERDIIKVTSVRNRILDPSYGYLRISNFQTKTTADLLKAVKAMKEESGGSLKGLVLDLRNNPGGVLSGAVGVSDAFLNEGMIVYTDGREDDSKLRYDATEGDVLDGAPLVVLVNGGSASASEIVAGAMQDHGRAIILGSKTFGKGSVQTIQDLPAGGAVKLTTSRYYTPNGRSIQSLGIEPDIATRPGSWTRPEGSGFDPLTESSLPGALSNTTIIKAEEADEAAKVDDPVVEGEGEEEKEDNLVYDDYQLFEALNLLKGLTILSKKSS